MYSIVFKGCFSCFRSDIWTVFLSFFVLSYHVPFLPPTPPSLPSLPPSYLPSPPPPIIIFPLILLIHILWPHFPLPPFIICPLILLLLNQWPLFPFFPSLSALASSFSLFYGLIFSLLPFIICPRILLLLIRPAPMALDQIKKIMALFRRSASWIMALCRRAAVWIMAFCRRVCCLHYGSL
jgi:hypothetical protein